MLKERCRTSPNIPAKVLLFFLFCCGCCVFGSVFLKRKKSFLFSFPKTTMKTFSLLLLLLSLSSLPFLLHAQEDEENPCEYDCVHGTCVQAEDSTDYYCECETNWFGDDCTIYDKYLNSEEVARDVVGRGEWKYYRHEVQSSGVKLTWFMNATRDGKWEGKKKKKERKKEEETLKTKNKKEKMKIVRF